jgi:hypothetical protein
MAIQRFQQGSDAVRDKLNQLVDAVNVLMGIRGDEQFIGVNRTAGGVTVALNLAAVLARVARKGPDVQWARVTGSTSLGNNQWKYTISTAAKYTAGYGAWEDDDTTKDATAYNAAEELNTASQLHGVVDLTQTDSLGTTTITVHAIPNGQPVLVTPVLLNDGTIEYEFYAPNDLTDSVTCA